MREGIEWSPYFDHDPLAQCGRRKNTKISCEGLHSAAQLIHVSLKQERQCETGGGAMADAICCEYRIGKLVLVKLGSRRNASRLSCYIDSASRSDMSMGRIPLV